MRRAVFAKGAEQNTVQQFLGAAQDFGRGDGGVLAAQAGEDALADVRVKGVELVGERAPDGFGGAEQFVEVALAVRGNDTFGAQEEDKALEQGFIGGQSYATSPSGTIHHPDRGLLPAESLRRTVSKRSYACWCAPL
jgi:hypothetical protein